MSNPIPDAYKDLLTGKAFAYLGTVMPDGTPQVTPVWIDYDGVYILVNTARGRLKDRNMEARPQVGMTIQDPQARYRYLAIQGRVIGIVEDDEGAHEHINMLSRRYDGKDFNYPPGQFRRIFKIRPEKVFTGD